MASTLLDRLRDPLTRRLVRAGSLKYWNRRHQREAITSWLSRWNLRTRDLVEDKRADTRLVPALLRSSARTALGALALLVSVELIAVWLDRADVEWARRAYSRLEAGDYQTLVSAIVGAEVFFLAMFYATVGVIASTSYQAVPGEIRKLFVHERGSRLFTRSVVRALLIGVLVLAMGVIDVEPHALTVLFLILLTVYSVVALARLGTDLFNFFDVSSLSTSLPTRFIRAAGAAGATKRRPPNAARQRQSHTAAGGVLRIYAQLSTLLRERQTNETAAPRRVIRQLLLPIAASYSAIKPTIPISSAWHDEVPAHQNWLTLEQHRLGLALDTRTGVRPDVVPDRLWVEREIAARIQDLLPLLLEGGDGGAGIAIADEALQLVSMLASRLQTEEARLLRRAIAKCLVDAADRARTDGPSYSSAHSAATLQTFRLAAEERATLSLTALLLGIASAARAVDAGRFRQAVDKATESDQGPYRVGAPRELLRSLEDMRSGIALEERCEGHRVTPSWWVEHYAARAFVRQLLGDATAVIRDTEEEVGRIEAVDIKEESDRAAVMTFAALELVSKLGTHLPAVQAAAEELRQLRNDNTGDEMWPEETPDASVASSLERRLLAHLGKIAPHLDPSPHDDSRPDLFGQAYKVLYDATYWAILGADVELAGQLFPVVLFTADRARQRLVDDLSDHAVRTQFMYGTEPLIDLMELSGYALLLDELNGAGIWVRVRTLWDALLKDQTAPALAEQLTGILRARESIFALTQGGLERTNRQQRLAGLLRERGIEGSRFWSPLGKRAPAHHSPIVRAFAPDQLGSMHGLAELFVVEYLIKQPGCENLELPHRADMLRRELERERQRDDEGADGDGSPAVGTDDDPEKGK